VPIPPPAGGADDVSAVAADVLLAGQAELADGAKELVPDCGEERWALF
jgi:hypothetical protein